MRAAVHVDNLYFFFIGIDIHKIKDCGKVDFFNFFVETRIKTYKMRDFTPLWVLEELISERANLARWAVKNVVHMLENGATIPFIARYRKEQTHGMEVDKLREIKTLMEELK